MSVLQELREEVESQDKAEVVEQEVVEEVTEEVEPSLEVEAEEVTEDEPEVDDIDLDLDDESEKAKPTPEQALVFKLTKEKKRRKEADSELEQLKAEIEALKEGQATAAPVPQNSSPIDRYAHLKQPVMNYDGIFTEDDYRKAYMKWELERREVDRQYDQQEKAKINNDAQTKERAVRLAERAATFISSNKIKADNATTTIQAGIQGLDEALGRDGVALDLLDNIGEGSEKLAYYLGRNPDALTTARKLMESDPRGFKVNSWLTKTAIKLESKNSKRISKAPAPDSPLTPDGSSATAKALQSKYDNEKDFSKLKKIREQARAAGVKLK